MTDFKVGDRVKATGRGWRERKNLLGEVVAVRGGSECPVVVFDGDDKDDIWNAWDSLSVELVEVANPFEHQVRTILTELGDLIIEKNAKYGDAILNPMQIFSKQTPIERVKSRLDDKLSRIARGDGTGDEDTVLDAMGYLVLLKIAESESD